MVAARKHEGCAWSNNAAPAVIALSEARDRSGMSRPGLPALRVELPTSASSSRADAEGLPTGPAPRPSEGVASPPNCSRSNGRMP
jgi:hypothetical protein